MNCKLSIIIPVYNIAQYLRHCLQSVSDQGLTNYEVLLVNDGSYDNSQGICIEWCNEHHEFRLINHEKNKGLSEARNTGIAQAKGEYITFVDSDDYLEPGTLANGMQCIDGADVIEYPIILHHLTKTPQKWEPTEGDMDYLQWMVPDGFTHCFACNKIFKKSLWDNICFPPGKYYEDIFTIPLVLKKAKVIRGIKKGTYYYCHRNGSISNTPKISALKDYVEALVELNKLPENKDNIALYIRSLNAQMTYRQYGGSEKMVPKRQIPWTYIIKSKVLSRHGLKALWFKTTYHG